jgi:hypothetical protein
MHKSKILLTVLFMLAIGGGALGYKASRAERIFYLDTTTMLSGSPATVCELSTTYTLSPSPSGFRTIKASTASINVPCPVISVIPSL